MASWTQVPAAAPSSSYTRVPFLSPTIAENDSAFGITIAEWDSGLGVTIAEMDGSGPASSYTQSPSSAPSSSWTRDPV